MIIAVRPSQIIHEIGEKFLERFLLNYSKSRSPNVVGKAERKWLPTEIFEA